MLKTKGCRRSSSCSKDKKTKASLVLFIKTRRRPSVFSRGDMQLRSVYQSEPSSVSLGAQTGGPLSILSELLQLLCKIKECGTTSHAPGPLLIWILVLHWGLLQVNVLLPHLPTGTSLSEQQIQGLQVLNCEFCDFESPLYNFQPTCWDFILSAGFYDHAAFSRT